MRKCFELAILLIIAVMPELHCETRQDSVRIFFRQSNPDLEFGLSGNRRALEVIEKTLCDHGADSIWMMTDVSVTGGASPEGTVKFNQWLSERRADALYRYLADKVSLPDSIYRFTYLGRDWEGLIKLVQKDENVPDKERTLALLHELKKESDASDYSKGDQSRRLRRFAGGRPWKYMYKTMFPSLRSSQLTVTYEKRPNPAIILNENPTPSLVMHDTLMIRDTVYYCPELPCKPFYMGVKTNLLLDALLLPNIGVEFYLGKGFSISAFWMYGWWKCDHKHNYWRAYGGDIEFRKWFGTTAKEKPLSGHHVGVYAQMYTYDFELGHKGYLAPRWSFGAGVSYGYSLPVAPRLNIDFGLSVGYQGGKYKEYRPVDNCYVWQSTKQRHWIGPTKAEVTLVWLIGCDNINRSKLKNKTASTLP